MCGVRRAGPEQSFDQSRRHRCWRGEGVSWSCPAAVCDTLVRALKLLSDMHADGENLVGTIFEGLQEQSRPEITNALRKFTVVDK